MPVTPDWVAPVLTLAGTALVVLGGTLGAILTYRVQRRAQDTEAKKAAAVVEQATTARENSLIDQLQEELNRYRSAADERATAQDKRMERIELENAQLRGERESYRAYAHKLRGHIYSELGPPPPEWPDGVTP